MLQYTAENIAGLKCHLLDEAGLRHEPKRLLVLCHGFGAPGTDLMPLAEELYQLNAVWSSATRFVFPEAPLDLAPYGMPGGRAWWMIDMMRLTRLSHPDHLREFVSEAPQGMIPAANQLRNVVEELLNRSGLAPDRCVLGGFSQGSMIATQVALDLREAPAGLCILSGCLINARDWSEKLAHRTSLSVFQSHGAEDPILPFQGAVWLNEQFVNAGIAPEFHAFRGGHAIPRGVIEQLSRFLSEQKA